MAEVLLSARDLLTWFPGLRDLAAYLTVFLGLAASPRFGLLVLSWHSARVLGPAAFSDAIAVS